MEFNRLHSLKNINLYTFLNKFIFFERNQSESLLFRTYISIIISIYIYINIFIHKYICQYINFYLVLFSYVVYKKLILSQVERTDSECIDQNVTPTKLKRLIFRTIESFVCSVSFYLLTKILRETLYNEISRSRFQTEKIEQISTESIKEVYKLKAVSNDF